MATGRDAKPEMSGDGSARASLSVRLERAGREAWWALGLILLVGVGFYLLQRFGSFVIPSLIGIVLATTLSPIVGWMERRRVPRLLGALIVSTVVVLLLVLLA